MPDLSVEDAARRSQTGLLVGIVCSMIWGFLPLLFDQLRDVSSVTVVADRTVWSLLLVGIILAVRGRLGEAAAALRDPATFRALALSAGLLAANWLIYVWAVQTGQALEGSFGYFINPLVNVALGMAVLGERQSRPQMLAILIALVAIGVQAVAIGRIPFIALSIALTFGTYGLVRKTVRVESAGGLFVETLILVPLAIAYLVFTFVHDGGIGPHGNPRDLALLMLTGPSTAVPLLLFAYSVRRLRLTTVGMLQYISPSIQFLLAVFVLREPINLTQLLSFGLIWLSLVIYSADTVLKRNRAMG